MLLYTIALLLLSSFAAPVPLVSELGARAGGPVGKPIPASCLTPLIKQPTDSFRPNQTFITAYQIYSYFLPSETTVSDETGYRQCLEGCYGFGSPDECKSVAWAHNVPYTASGSIHNNGTACLMFSRRLDSGNLEATTDGTFTGAKASSIDCPPR